MDRRQRLIPPRTVEPDHTLVHHTQNVPMPDLSAMVRQMIRESQGLTNDDWGISWSHTPFTDDILYAEPPRRFRMPTLPMYEGNSDPNQHILKYEWSMTAARADDAVKCRSFPIPWGASPPCGSPDCLLDPSPHSTSWPQNSLSNSACTSQGRKMSTLYLVSHKLPERHSDTT